MDLGSNFSAKLEPFLLMAKSLKGAAAAKLIQDATSAAGVYVFMELLELPNIKELANSEQHSQFYRLLELFSFKTYQDYLQNKSSLPPLNASQTIKLKHLSIVSLASSRRILPYSMLLQSLEMPTIRELEDLVIDAIYLDVLRGKLDQKQQQLEVEYTMGRDLEPQGGIENILAALKDWASTTMSVLNTLDTSLVNLAKQAAAAKLKQEDHDKALLATLKDVHEKQKEKGSGIGMGGMSVIRTRFGGGSSLMNMDIGGKQLGERMDVDDEGDGAKGKNRKAPPQREDQSKQTRKRNRF